MTTKRPFLPLLLLWGLLVSALLPLAAHAQTAGSSQFVTLACTGSPCPYGPFLSGHAISWPAGTNALSTRLGYTVSHPAYLPSNVANGTVIQITSGVATVLANSAADATTRQLTVIAAGGSYEVTGLAPGEVLSVQSPSAFNYVVTLPPLPEPGTTSEFLPATCTGSPCPFGPLLSAHVLVWPSSAQATSTWLGYTSPKPIYLSANRANGALIWIDSGTATVYAGRPYQSTRRTLANLTAGQVYEVTGVAPDEVVSVLGPGTFSYSIDLPTPPAEEPGELMQFVKTYWRCNIPGCTYPDWVGWSLAWPEGTAYSSNGRTGDQSRTTYSESGELLYPYMGSWANGCDITAVDGPVLIVEWQRGSSNWRETILSPGQRYILNLQAPENGAIIEGLSDATVEVRSCTPQPLP